MYCPSCGTESTLDLNYCNRCGANMVQSLQPAPAVSLDITKPVVAIAIATVIITLGGFIILAVAAENLAHVFQQNDPMMALLVLGMTTIMVSDIMLIRLLSRIVRASFESKQAPQLPEPLTQPVPKQLPNQRFEPIPSVTEHTTRTFTPVFNEPADRGTK